MYNSYVSGNAETLSISSDDSIWDSDSDEEIQTSTPLVAQNSTRLYHEHEEHSYCSTAEKLTPNNQFQQGLIVTSDFIRKRKRSESSCSTSEDEEDGSLKYTHKRPAYSPSKDQRFLRCIHHHSTSMIFQNGASPSEGVKQSPFQQEYEEDSSDSEEDEEEEVPIKSIQSSKTEKIVCDVSEQSVVPTPEKYKRAILKRYLSCNESEEVTHKVLKTSHTEEVAKEPSKRVLKGEKRKLENAGLEDKQKTDERPAPKKLKESPVKRILISSPGEVSERQNCELEAAEALATLFRNHQNKFGKNNHLPNLKLAAQEMEMRKNITKLTS